MCLHMFRLLNKVKWEKECRTLITFSFHLSCSFLYAFTVYRSLWISRSCCDTRCVSKTPHSVIVSVLTGSLDYLVIQLKQWDLKKKPQHISIMLLTECWDATLPGIYTHLHVYYLRKLQLLTWGKESQFEALLHIQHPPNIHPHTQTVTHQNHIKAGKESILGDRK